MRKQLNRLQRGVTLFELMLVLFVAAFIAAAVGTIYVKVNNAYKANATLDLVQQLVASVRSLYSQSDYTGLNLTALANTSVIPVAMCGTPTSTGCGSLIYPFGAADINVVSATPTEFTVQLTAVPQSVCIDMALRFFPGTVELTIGGTAISATGTNATPTTAIITACAAASTANFVMTYN